MKVIAQGAEAIVYDTGETVIKHRFEKKYRICVLDKKLRKTRTRREAKVLSKLAAIGVAAPSLLSVDDKEMIIEMSKVAGKRLKEVFALSYMKQLGKIIRLVHDNHIIHGDLTTSNVLVADTLVLIDFGLSYFSEKDEDKAVDLYLFERALASTHYTQSKEALRLFYEGYGKGSVLERLEKVRARGRNKAKG